MRDALKVKRNPSWFGSLVGCFLMNVGRRFVEWKKGREETYDPARRQAEWFTDETNAASRLASRRSWM